MPKNQLLGADFSKEELFWNGSDVVKVGVCVQARMRRCVNEAFRNGGTSADVSRSQSHKARAFWDGVASADVSRRHGLRLQDAPP